MGRHPTAPHCEWPHDTCRESPTRQERLGAAFCEVHYRAWTQIMQDLVLMAGLRAASTFHPQGD